MADFRFIEIEEEEEEDAEEIEEEEDDEDYDDGEFEENLFPPGIILPVNLNLIDQLEAEDSDYDDYDDDDDDDDDDDYEEDENYEDEVDDNDYEEEEEVDDESITVKMTSPRVSSLIADGRTLQGTVVINDGSLDNSNDSDLCERKEEVNTSEIDGLFCPICFQAWTSGGDHQICCLPCGHIYGLSCIKKWLQRRRSSGKCPQCNNLCTLKDVRVLYATRLCVADEELHKRVQSLEAKCAYLEQKAAPLTADELIDQICSNPTLAQRLATALGGLHQQQVFP